MSTKTIKPNPIYWLACALATLLATPSHAVLDIPTTPLFLSSTGVKPNFILSLDDSLSMYQAFVPDSLSSTTNSSRFKSSYFNAMYYNPNLQYYPPPKYDGANCTLDSATNPATCFPNIAFTAAPINGFATSNGTGTNASSTCNPLGTSNQKYSPVNLSQNYAPTNTYNPSNNSQTCTSSSAETTTIAAVTQTINYSIRCNVTFTRQTGDDRIDVASCSNSNATCTRSDGASCSASAPSTSGPFTSTTMPTGTSLTITGSGGTFGNNDTYTVTSRSSTTRLALSGLTAPSSAVTESSRTLTWNITSTITSGGTINAYPAFYFLFYSQAGVAKPSACTATVSSQKTDDDCYIKIVVGSATDIYKNPDGSSASTAQKQQNFANWYSYYRTRNLAMVSGAMTALTGLDGEVRVAWQGLETCDTFSSSSCKGWDNPVTGVDNRMRKLDETLSNGKTHRQELYQWLTRFPTSGYTPLRTAAKRAGQYVDTSVTPLSATSPWAETPPSSAGTYHACRRNIHLIMTDGLWNSLSDSTINYANADSETVTLPSGYKMPSGSTTWSPSHPYTDSNSNSLADIAFYYWSRDLAPGTGMPNNLTPLYVDRSGDAMAQWVNPKNDPAEWQHLNTFAISLGLSEVLVTPNQLWAGDTYSGGYANFVSGSASWQQTCGSGGTALGGGCTPGNAYDLWHAALNGRGQFYSAESASDIKTAFQSVVDTVSSVASAGGGAGLGSNSTKIATDSAVYQATFNGDWSGTLQARPVQADGSLGVAYWEAGSRIPYAASRYIYTLNGTSKQSFDSCSNNLAAALNLKPGSTTDTDNLCSQRLAWLRGYQEVTNATWAGGIATFTVPAHGLQNGDSVVISGVTSNIESPPGSGTWVESTAYNGTFNIIDVDTNTFTVSIANDPGIFTTVATGKARYANFRERTTVLGDIMNSDPVYVYREDLGYGTATAASLDGHNKYDTFVVNKTDATKRVPMVYVGANDGMLHAFNAENSGSDAGKELFAYVPAGVYGNLNRLPDPGYLKNPDSHRFFVDGSPTVGDAYLDDGLSDNGWNTVLVGSLGLGGKSVFALDITHPKNFSASNIKWEYSNATHLGLTVSQPQIGPDKDDRWVTIFGNGYNSASGKASLFVLDLADGSSVTSPTPIATNNETDNGLSTPFLFDADGDKIIDYAYAGDLKGNLWKFKNTNGTWTLGNGGLPLFTAEISGVRQAITSQPQVAKLDNGKRMVFFGTGRYLTPDDLTDDKTQTFYAIEDNDANTTVLRTELQPRTFTQTGDYRKVDPITSAVANPKGWYLDFPSTTGSPAERIVSAAIVKKFTSIEDRVIFVTMTPTNDPCDRGGDSWLMELRTDDGGAFSEPVMDTNDDHVIDGSDEIVSGKKLPDSLGISTTPLWMEGSDKASKLFTGSKGTTYTESQKDDPKTTSHGPTRVYWQQIL